jgi:large subunit ribosomal protein L31e
MRLRLSRRRNDEEDAKEKLYTYVTYVPGVAPKGMRTEVVDQ